MPVKVEILRDGRVSLTTCTEPLDLKEIVEANRRAGETYLAEAMKPVHSIVDCTGVRRLPSNILSHNRSMAKELHPMIGTLIIVTANTFVSLIATVVSKTMSSHKVLVCRSLAEAWTTVDRILSEEVEKVRADQSS